MRFEGKVALITAAGAGIGKSMAEIVVREGGTVVAVENQQERLDALVDGLDNQAGKVVSKCIDATHEIQARRTVQEVVGEFGRIDILVNAVGGSTIIDNPAAEIDEMPFEDWQKILNFNLSATFIFTNAIVPHMKAQKWGRIINSLNTGAKATPAEGGPTAISRAAGMSLTKAMACEYAPDNILVNGLMVGRIESDQWVQRHKNAGDNKGFDEWLADFGKGLPMGRVGKAEEYAAIACLLASDHGGYITGTAINVDGGLCPVV